MNKQKLCFSCGFLFFVTGWIVGATPLKVYAGTDVVRGTSVESSSFSGGTFNSSVNGSVAGTGVSIELDGSISLSSQVQQSLNDVVNSILNQAAGEIFINGTELSTTFMTPTVILLLESSTNVEASNNFQASLFSSGVPQNLVTELTNNLSGLFEDYNFTATPSPGAQLQPVEQVASTKLAQSGQSAEKPSLDLNKLNAAIKAYNQIVLKSDAQTLNNLSKNPEFVKSGEILKQLRAALIPNKI